MTCMMAAALAKGETVIENAAREPEIGDVAECLIKMGAQIEGIGTRTLRIQGVDRLKAPCTRCCPTGSRPAPMLSRWRPPAAMSSSKGARRSLLEKALRRARARPASSITETDAGIRVARNGAGLEPVNIETQPFPGFPTDLQAQFMALMTQGRGHQRHPRDHLREPLHARAGAGPARRRHPAARATRPPSRASSALRGAQVMATDLRASVSLVIAGLDGRGRDHRSTASITSTAASSAWSRSCRAAAPASSAWSAADERRMSAFAPPCNRFAPLRYHARAITGVTDFMPADAQDAARPWPS